MFALQIDVNPIQLDLIEFNSIWLNLLTNLSFFLDILHLPLRGIWTHARMTADLMNNLYSFIKLCKMRLTTIDSNGSNGSNEDML